jgi:PelA/Pel-15E family pectate lyase
MIKQLSCGISICLLVVVLPLALQSQSINWKQCLDQPASWYGTAEAKRIADNVLLHQGASGGWPKNIDMARVLTKENRDSLLAGKKETETTIDNTATYTQMRFLAKVYAPTRDQRLRSAFIEGLDYLLAAQYANGGWPQFYPLRKGYYTHITFNDDAITGVLNLFKDIVEKKREFAFVDASRRARASAAIDNGIECILKCQVKVRDTLTGWCAQHDETTFAPAKARSYELPSLSGKEGVGIVEFLMRIEKPTPAIVSSIKAAVAWFDRARVKGQRVILRPDTLSPTGVDKIVIEDPAAPSLWARFYDIGTNRPIYVSRDGIIRYRLSEISYERRNHYGWLDVWPEKLLTSEYPKWKKKLGI